MSDASDRARPELVLGSVQWGLRYGIANASGQPSRAAVRALLTRGEAAGLRWIDTARAYGEAEQVIGACASARWRVVTKVTPSLDADPRAQLLDSLDASCRALGRETLDVVLLHRPAHRELPGVWDALLDARARGRIGRVGISATTPDEAWAALDDPSIDQLQVAANLLDQRLARAGFFARARAAGKIIHVRSVYLQGVAFLPLDRLPPHLEGLRGRLETLDALARAHHCTRASLFLRYALGLGASGLVLGCEAPWQLDSNLEMWSAASSSAVPVELPDRVACTEPALVDPARWP